MFFPQRFVEKARRNIERYGWAADIRRRAVEHAAPWAAMSDDELWDLMFGNTIKRSWMVLSNGECPACKAGVPMYNWVMDAMKRPWKLKCPHCGELFPKNDFAAFYRSGLDEHRIFDPARADRSLLFNVEHAAPGDPLRSFGVDDGEGYREGDRCWRFVGTYLIYGQWKQRVLNGICNLAVAHVLTGEEAYAHKAGLMLDRVADLYPTHDFGKEGVMYEGAPRSGYVSTWHDACEETRMLVVAYDQVREALAKDAGLVGFLSAKAKWAKLSNPKAAWEEVRRNIEDRILRDALNSTEKIHSNYPRTPICQMVIKCVLDWPGSRGEVMAILDEVLSKATAVDGVTGEKGLSAYTCYTIQGLAELLAQFEQMEPGFIKGLLTRHPRLHQMYRFHVDTWCLDRYYPGVGDATCFADTVDRYVGVHFGKETLLAPSMYRFLFDLYQATGDAAFVKVLYRANNNSTDGLPHDIFADDPAAFQQAVRDVIAREGTDLNLAGVNKREWCLAILRSGKGTHARAAWLDYDSGGGHGHADGMNLGLFASGLDLLPDLGYPPVQFGGWESPRALWYHRTASHNTVVVDGKDHHGGWGAPTRGRTMLWSDGGVFRAVRASGPEMIQGWQFERTVAMVEVSERDFYLVDIFRVVGGCEHVKFMHSHFGTVATEGLKLRRAEAFGQPDWQMRNFRRHARPAPGWSVTWQIEDRRKLLPPGADVRLRYTDLTAGAEAWLAQGWIAIGGYDGNAQDWIPRVMTRRRASEDPLASTFVAVIEPYEGERFVSSVRRLRLVTPEGRPCPDGNVAVEVRLKDGRRDLIIARDTEDPLGLSPRGTEIVQPKWGVSLSGELCFVRAGG